MIRPVLGTITARVVITLLNLILVMVVGQRLGAEGLGTISLLVLGVTVILAFGQIVGGGGLVYLVPRWGVHTLLAPSYLWTLFSMLIGIGLLLVFPLSPPGYALHVLGLAFLQCLNTIHLNILAGRQRIALQNSLLVAQVGIQVGLFVGLSAVDGTSLQDYLWATYAGHGLTVLISGTQVRREISSPAEVDRTGLWKALFTQGGLGQLANVFQLLSYRSAYLLIDQLRGPAALGVYSVATQLAEGAWLVPKSIGGVLYSTVSNLDAAERQRVMALTLLKISVAVGTLCCALLILVPDGVYARVFGPEVTGLRPILLWLTPGLMAMSGSQVLSHYLSGTGRIHHNAITSGLCLAVLLVVGTRSIPTDGLAGAAMAASIAYCVSAGYQLLVFMKLTVSPVSDLLPRKSDLQLIQRIARRLLE